MPNLFSLDLESSSTQYASVVNASALLNPTGNFTAECWFRAESLSANMSVLTNVCTDDSFGPIYKILVNSDGSVTGQTWDSGSGFLNVTSTSGLVTTNTWYHIAFVKASATSWEVFLGTQGGSDSSVATSSSSRTISGTGKTGLRAGANEATTGSSNPSGGYFDGLIDEIRFWGTNRSLVQINASKETILVGNETNLNLYAQLENGYTDSTANGFNLTASGSPVFSSTVPFVGGGRASRLTLLGVT